MNEALIRRAVEIVREKPELLKLPKEEALQRIAEQLKSESAEELHREKHLELHKALDELVADFIGQTNALPSVTNLMAFMQWSHAQTENPTGEPPKPAGGKAL